jgi:hypothetical protein
MTRCYSDPLDPKRVVLTRNPYISDAAYSEMVEKMPIPCTDAVLTVAGDKAIYLAERCVYPMKGLWIFGGRISFNDASPEQSIARCLELETGQRFELSRFVKLADHLYSWVKTKQGDFPGKNLVLTYQIEVTKEELARMSASLAANEYNQDFGIQRFTRERLVNENVHPALIDLYDDIYKK